MWFDPLIESKVYDHLLRLDPRILEEPYLNAFTLLKLSSPCTKEEILSSQRVEEEALDFILRKCVEAGLLERNGEYYVCTHVFHQVFKVIKTYIVESPNKRLSWAILYAYRNSLTPVTLGILVKLLGESEDWIEERVKKLGLEFDYGVLKTSHEQLSAVRDLLLDSALKIEWPSVHVARKPREKSELFKLETRRFYVDLPWQLFEDLFDQLSWLNDLNCDEAFEKARKIIEQQNYHLDALYEGCVKVSLRKYAKYMGIRINVDMPNFVRMLYRIAEGDFPEPVKRSMEEYKEKEDETIYATKYMYVSLYKHFLLPTAVKFLAGASYEYIGGIREQIANLRIASKEKENIADAVNYVRELVVTATTWWVRRRWKMPPHFCMLAPDLLEMLNTIEYTAQRGLISSCITEVRRVLESFAWAFLDDILYFNSLSTNNISPLTPYKYTHPFWYLWAQKKEKRILRFNKFLCKLASITGLKQEEIDRLLGKISTYVFLLAASILQENASNHAPSVNLSEFKENLLREVKGLAGIDDKAKHKILKYFYSWCNSRPNAKVVVPCFPISIFSLKYADKILGTSDGFYRQYMEASKSTHYYSMAWNALPLTSILELTILRKQLERFSTLLKIATTYWWRKVSKVDTLIREPQ